MFIGISVFYQAAQDGLWVGIVFGLYFSATGFFALGCAGGECYVPYSNHVSDDTTQYKELK